MLASFQSSASLYHPEQGHQRLSFMVEDVASSRPSRHLNIGMSSASQHSASSITFLSQKGASTGGIGFRAHYTLQFGQNPPRFDGVHLTVVSSALKASVLHQKLSSLLLKGAIEEVPQSDLKQRFQDLFILDLRHLNLYLYKGKFKMLMLKTYVPDSSGSLFCHCRP